MRLAYLVHWSGGASSGVFLKVIAQVREWTRSGHDVALAVLSGQDTTVDWSRALPSRVRLLVATYETSLQRLRAPATLHEWLCGCQPELLYFRHDPWTPALEALMRRMPTVIEINSDDLAERPTGSFLRSSFHQMTRQRVFRRAAGVVFVSDELRHLPAFATLRDVPQRVIANGIGMDQVPSIPPSTSSKVRLLLLASAGQPWQGVDLLPTVLDQRPSWHVDVVGISSEDYEGAQHSRLSLHGPMTRAEFWKIASHADVGLGTLGLFRKGLQESVSLKHREYLAMGLPVVLGCRDPDLPGNAPWACVVPNTPTGLLESLQAVDRFIDDWKGRRVARSDVSHLDVVEKEGQRLRFFQAVCNGTSR